ncbi:hypothetical protein GF337_19310 [candidate division KSB1 bacterium]|nr:hypothetical protein [candidate division KSB1 bacterium]
MFLNFARYWKYLFFAIIIVVSFSAFLQTSMVRTDAPWRYLEALYFSITLFIIGGLDIGFPHGGSPFVLIVLWICYFVAPLLALGFVYQFVQEHIFSQISPVLRGHTIICGMGRNGELIYRLIREYFPKGHKVVIIEKSTENPYSELLEKDPDTWWLKSDFTKPPVMQKAKLRRANRVYITTNLDLANIDAAVAIQEMKDKPQKLSLYCHLGNLELHQNFCDTIFKERKFSDIKLFNGYECVTRRFYENWIISKGNLNPNGVIFAILGFGRFGQMLFSRLASDPNRSANDEVVIATMKPNSEVDKLNYEYRKDSFESNCRLHSPLYADIHNPTCWEELNQIASSSRKQLVILICRDNDIGNLNLAISMKLRGPLHLRQSTIFCRMYRHTAREINDILEKRITKNQTRDILLFPMQEELKESFRQELFN